MSTASSRSSDFGFSIVSAPSKAHREHRPFGQFSGKELPHSTQWLTPAIAFFLGFHSSFYRLQRKTSENVSETSHKPRAKSALLPARSHDSSQFSHCKAAQIAAQMSLVLLPVPWWLKVTNAPVPVSGSHTNVTSSIPPSTTAPSGVTIMNNPS